MKKSLFNLITVAFAAVCALSLASCDFFLNGEDLKKELDQQIAYNNAPSVSVYLKADAELGEFLSDGEKSFKVGYDTEVQFTVNQESYVFEKLEAVVRNSPETSRSKSVQFTEVESDAKKGIYKINVKVLEQVSDIMIRPVCKALPKIAGITPALDVTGCLQDSEITISFNKKMDTESFKDENGKIKGITITTSDGEDLSEYFYEPIFDSDNKSLVILPLCLKDKTKYLLPPDGNKNNLNIEVNYTFINVKDADGLEFTENGTHSYKINKNFSDQESVTVVVQNPVAASGSFLSSGEKICIVRFGFDIEFTLNKEAYIFQGFEAVSQNKVLDESFVSFENRQYDDETGIYRARVRVHKSASDIIIRPNCQLVSNTDVTITQSEKGTKTISPADKTKVQSFINREYSITFSPDEDYEFIRWELYDIKTNAAITNGTYVTIKKFDEASTTYEVTQIPEDDIELGLRPIVVERPQLISNTPQGSGILKDSSIQVLFDHDMDKESIYYTKSEVIALQESGITSLQFLPPLKEEEISGNLENHYGYTKDGLTYFKNIVLINNKTGVNLNDKYEEPYFENKRTLTIPASKKEGKVLDHYTQILVTIEKGFFYSEKIDETTSKPVTMRGIKKWSYQVTNKGDTDKLVFQTTGEGANETPVFELKLEDKEEFDALTCANESPVLLNDDNTVKSTLNFMRNDIINEKKKPRLYGNMVLQDPAGGSGPNSTFTVWYQRIVDGDYVTPSKGDERKGQFAREYTTTTAQDAFLDGTFDLDLPADGLYRIWFEFSDRSSNSFCYPAGADAEDSTIGFYVIQDTQIDMKAPGIEDTSVRNDIKLNLEWEPCIDLAKTQIRYKKHNDTDWSVYEDVTSVKEKEYASLTLATDYDFEIVYTDFAGNTQTKKLYPKSADFNISITGTPSKTLYFTGEKFDKTGLEMTVSLTNEVSWTEDINLYHNFTSSEICWQGKKVAATYTFKEVTKSADVNATYYVAESDALTQVPVKLTDYSGTFSGGVYYKFGDFPQTIKDSSIEVSDSSTSYNGWYLGSDGYFYEKVTAQKAPWASYDYYFTDGTKFVENDVYYFKVEPVKWRVLTDSYDIDGDSGTETACLLLSEVVLTGKITYYPSEYKRTISNVTVVASNYEYSTVRAWLNGSYVSNDRQAKTYENNGFLQNAFTDPAAALIKETTLDNSNLKDKLFLLHRNEILNTEYGFTNDIYGKMAERIRIATDYAIANRAWQSKTEGVGCNWFLRTLTYTEGLTSYVNIVDTEGGYDSDRCYYTYDGIVPALCLSSSDLPQ